MGTYRIIGRKDTGVFMPGDFDGRSWLDWTESWVERKGIARDHGRNQISKQGGCHRISEEKIEVVTQVGLSQQVATKRVRPWCNACATGSHTSATTPRRYSFASQSSNTKQRRASPRSEIGTSKQRANFEHLLTTSTQDAQCCGLDAVIARDLRL